MKLYLVRHGETDANRLGLSQSPKTPLSEDGLKQAKIVARRLAGIKIDIIYSSTYLRAKRTAEVISKEIDEPIEYWGKLIEAGSSEENFKGLNRRAEKILEHLISHHRDQSVLCVSHATMIEAIIAKLVFGENLSDKIMSDIKRHFGTTNTGISICEFTEKNGWILNTFNDSSHL